MSESSWDEKTRGPKMSNTTGKVIWKYQLPILEQFSIKLPKGAEIIRVDDVDGMFWLWAVVDTTAELIERKFHAVKAGGKMPDCQVKYIGFCKLFIQMELALYIFEELVGVKAEECITYNYLRDDNYRIPSFTWKPITPRAIKESNHYY